MSLNKFIFTKIILIYILASVECNKWWNNLGISYANNEDTDENQQKFIDYNDYNKHVFHDKSGPEFSGFAQKFRTRHEWRGDHQTPRTGHKPITLARIQTKRTLQIIPYNTETEETEPQVIEITSKPIPFRLKFNTLSNPLDVQQIMDKSKESYRLARRYFMLANLLK